MTENKSPSSHVIYGQDDEIDLLELWGILWVAKFFIVSMVIFFAAVSLIFSLLLTNIYRAEALLAPADEESRQQITGQIGFAANLAGVNLGENNTKTVNALATLRSREFTKKFIEEHNLLPWLFASEYDSSEGRSLINASLYNQETNAWLEVDSLFRAENRTSAPTDWEAYRKFSEIFTLSEQNDTGLVVIAIEWPDPVLAALWVNNLVEDINGHVKTKDMQEARSAINYLREQLENTQLVEMQQVLYQLIESQTRTLMLADIREGYVFETIDSAVVPEEKSKPFRSLIFLLGALVGGIISVIYILMMHYKNPKLGG